MAQTAWIALSRAHADAYARGQLFVQRAADIDRRYRKNGLLGVVIFVTLLAIAGTVIAFGPLLVFPQYRGLPWPLMLLIGFCLPSVINPVERRILGHFRAAAQAKLEADCDFRGFNRYDVFVTAVDEISGKNEALGAVQIVTEPVIVSDPILRRAIEEFDAPPAGAAPSVAIDPVKAHIQRSFGR